jgi:hypothetical protein
MGLFAAVLGIAVLVLKLNNPRVQLLSAADVVALLAAGLCLGVSVALLTNRLTLRGKRL